MLRAPGWSRVTRIEQLQAMKRQNCPNGAGVNTSTLPCELRRAGPITSHFSQPVKSRSIPIRFSATVRFRPPVYRPPTNNPKYKAGNRAGSAHVRIPKFLHQLRRVDSRRRNINRKPPGAVQARRIQQQQQ